MQSCVPGILPTSRVTGKNLEESSAWTSEDRRRQRANSLLGGCSGHGNPERLACSARPCAVMSTTVVATVVHQVVQRRAVGSATHLKRVDSLSSPRCPVGMPNGVKVVRHIADVWRSCRRGRTSRRPDAATRPEPFLPMCGGEDPAPTAAIALRHTRWPGNSCARSPPGSAPRTHGSRRMTPQRASVGRAADPRWPPRAGGPSRSGASRCTGGSGTPTATRTTASPAAQAAPRPRRRKTRRPGQHGAR